MNNQRIFKHNWQPYAIVFITNTCIMILELIAGRLIAPHVGVSLYTWTSIIGVVLAGISIGNFIGGSVADRWASRKLLAYMILAAGLFCITIFMGNYLGAPINNTGWHIIVRIIALTTAMFLLPSIILGMVSPIVVKLAVNDLTTTGSTVGRIYAAGAFGSILGTFVTGFFLISWIGTYAIVFSVAAVLFVLAISILFAGKWQFIILPVLIAFIGIYLIVQQGTLKSVCDHESNYFCIRIFSEEQNGQEIKTMILDKLVHSITNMDDPADLHYKYSHVYAEATELIAQDNPELKMVFIGGGGYTFPRYAEIYYPDAQIDVIEIDPMVTEVAFSDFGIPADTRISTFNLDARLFFNEIAQAGTYDLVFGDAFNDLSVPYHLTTYEFNELVHRSMTPGGFYMINTVDKPDGEFLLSSIHTLRQTFKYVYLVNPYFDRSLDTRITFVIIATDVPLSRSKFQSFDAGDGEYLTAEFLLSEDYLDDLLASHPHVLLTDTYAPVEQMLITVLKEAE